MNENNLVFQLKNKKSYPKILNDEIKLLSFSTENSTLIGSASYKIQKYPADIDLYEQVIKCCSKEDAIEYFYLGIKNIVNNIRLKENHWVIEVKCGIDDRYDIINNGYNITPNQLYFFLHNSINILKIQDYEKLNILAMYLDKNHSKDTIDEIYKILRDYYIIRWSSNDVLLGHLVRYGKKFYFKDCIDTHSPINIEEIAVVNDKFTDLSNFYVVAFHDKISDKDYVINFPQEYIEDGKKFVINGLIDGINKVLFSKVYFDPFKGIKRMYSLARLTNNINLFNKIEPIISSDLSALSQIKSEIATIIEIIEFTSNIPWNVFYSQLESIKWRIGGNMYIDDDSINEIIDMINVIIQNKYDIDKSKQILTNIKQILVSIVNSQAVKYLRDVNLYKEF